MKKHKPASAAPRGDGSFFRRYKQKYYPISADVPGTIYYCAQTDRERFRLCCHTKDIRVARQLVSTHLSGIDLSTPQRFLDTLAKAGERARKTLEADLTTPRKRRR